MLNFKFDNAFLTQETVLHMQAYLDWQLYAFLLISHKSVLVMKSTGILFGIALAVS